LRKGSYGLSATTRQETEAKTKLRTSAKEGEVNVIELFAGAAGLAQGFERGGPYKTVALFDIFEPAQRSYLAYRPDSSYLLQDVRDFDLTEVKQLLNGRPLHGILGGPPCQGFSINGKRHSEAEVNQLVITYAEVVATLKPCFLVMENVPQLLFHKLFQPLVKQLREEYVVTYGILNAAQYGAPQTRHRLFLTAYRKQFGITPTLPIPTHGKLGQSLYAYHLTDSDDRIILNSGTVKTIFGADPVIGREIDQRASCVEPTVSEHLNPLVTVGDAISDLNAEPVSDNQLQTYVCDPQSAYQRALRSATKQVANCTGRQHKGAPLRMVQSLREGGQPRMDAVNREDKRYYSQAYSRLHRAALARTLTTYFQNAGSGRFFHFQQPRTLTIREAARLQGFPDDFTFHGTLGEQMQLVGNAVPLPLAEAIGRHIAAQLEAALSG
jgi:DNA (cytosine-5)-methyltransferase 1